MAMQYEVNLTPSTGTVYILNLVNFLVNKLGFSRPRCGDGSTYDSTGALVTSAGSGAGGLGNNGAWIEVVAPDSSYAYVFQRGSSDVAWRYKVAPGPFTGGSPDGNSPGSNTDEVTRIGGGSDASPTTGTPLTTNNTYRQHIVGFDTAPYGWYSLGVVSSTGADTGFICHDPVEETPVEDLRPWVSIVSQAASTRFTTTALSADGTLDIGGWLGFTGTPAFQGVGAAAYHLAGSANLALPAAIGTNSNNGLNDDEWFKYYRRASQSSPNGKKGRSTMMKWAGRNVGSMIAGGSATGASIDRVYVGNVVLHYPDVTPEM